VALSRAVSEIRSIIKNARGHRCTCARSSSARIPLEDPARRGASAGWRCRRWGSSDNPPPSPSPPPSPPPPPPPPPPPRSVTFFFNSRIGAAASNTPWNCLWWATQTRTCADALRAECECNARELPAQMLRVRPRRGGR
jgi:hypothetical protein